MRRSTHEDSIQDFSVGVGKMLCAEPRPLGGYGGMLPRKILIFTCSEVVAGASEMLK